MPAGVLTDSSFMDLAMFVPLYFLTHLTIAAKLDRARKEDATESNL